MTAVLAIDVGQSGFRIASGDDVEDHPRGVDALTSPDRIVALADRIAEAAAAWRGASVGVGLSGFVAGSPAPGEIARLLVERLDAPRAIVAADAVTAFLGAVGPVPGTVTICGTGVAALGADGSGSVRRVDARGYLLGDAGGGFWIGRRGLRAGLDALEGRGPETALAAASARLGAPETIYQHAMASVPIPAYIAAFAPDVLSAADASDEVARCIVADAGAEIARTTVAARVAPGPVGLTGGLVRSAVYRETVANALTAVAVDAEELIIRPDASLDGARMLIEHRSFARSAFAGLIAEKEAA